MTTETSTSVLESRFSFGEDGEVPLPGIYEATPAEIAAHLLKAERTRIRRRTKELEAPAFKLDGNEVARIMMAAFSFEKKTRQHQETRIISTATGPRRVKKHYRGRLGARSLELLRVLVWFGRKHGQIYPALKKLADIIGCCQETIIEALGRLTDAGFVTKHRRSRLITTTDGPRWVQDSNAYEVHMPDADTGAGRLLCLLGLLPSGSTLLRVSVPKDRGVEKDHPNRGGFGWPAPYRMPDGTWC